MNAHVKNSIDIRKDEELVRAFQGGDKAAFDVLVVKYKDKVFNLCYRFLGDQQEANDSAQVVFIKVYRSLKKFRQESAFSTWIYRITANTCKNKIKSSEYRKKKKTVSLDNPGRMTYGDAPMEIQDAYASPMAELETKERMMLIQDALVSLPIDKRTVIVLHDIDGLSYEEISKVTGSNLGTVKSRLSRARRELKEKLRRIL